MTATVHRLPVKTRLRRIKGDQYEVFIDGLLTSWAYYRIVEHDHDKSRVLFNYIMEIQRTGEKTALVPQEVYDMIEPEVHMPAVYAASRE